MKSVGLWLWALLVPATCWGAPGTLQPLQGNTFLQRQGQALWEPIAKPTSVEEGDQIRTSNESLAFVILPDDHRVAVAADSYLVLSKMGTDETQLYLKAGNIRNKVRHLRLGQAYSVQTPTLVVAVRGTDFSVAEMAQAQKSQVRVFEGFVDVSALRQDVTHEITRVNAGQATQVDAQGHIETPQPLPGAAPNTVPPAAKHDGSNTKPIQTDEGAPRPHQGPPPPGAGPSGGLNWFDHPDQITPKLFDDAGMLSGPDGKHPPRPESKGPPIPNGPPLVSNPLNNPYGPTPFQGPNPFLPPPIPSGDGGSPTTLNPADPLQALKDEINRQNLASQLQGVLVGGLFQDGAVKVGPDGQLHQYADAIVQNGSDGIKFMNATMVSGRPGTLNYQTTTIRFNQNLPSDYTLATRTAFRSDSTMPTYYATDVDNYRSNTVDYLDVKASQGSPHFSAPENRYVTKFDQQKAEINHTVLYDCVSTGCTYLGGSAPSVSLAPFGGANVELKNQYSNGVFVARHVTYSDDHQQIPSLSNVPAGSSPKGYLTELNVHDVLVSNLFTHGPILSFGSSQSRILSGVDSILTNADAQQILTGHIPEGVPDGLFRS